jgi:hypothetical protein
MAFFLGARICRRPSGALGFFVILFLGLTPQATCLGSFGARESCGIVGAGPRDCRLEP